MITVSARVPSDQDASWRLGVGKTRVDVLQPPGLRGAAAAAILCAMAELLGSVQPLRRREVRRAVLRRPFTGACWRDTSFLLISFVTGLAGFTFVVAAVSTAGSLSLLVVGLPVAVLVAHADRWWCNLERWRVRMVGVSAIPSIYRREQGGGFVARSLSVLRDRHTWLDAVWMLVSFPVGLVGFILAIAGWTTVFALLSAPIWGWSIPGWIHAHDVAASIIAPFLAFPAAVLIAWLLRGWTLVHVRIARGLLGPSRAELERRVETLAATRAGAVDAAVTELQRVERDLHDGAQARLVALAMDLGLAEQRLSQADPDTALEHVASARAQAREAMAELRQLVRGIGPSILTDRGLDAALTALVSGRQPPVELTVELSPGPAGPRETAVYFVVAEALANARKHASASAVSVRVWEDEERRLIAEVGDDGIGGASFDAGSGLTGLAQRVAALDGTLTVVSPPGGPTTVRAELPCES